MATKRFLKRKRSHSKRGGKKTIKNKTNKKKHWTTAITAAQNTLTKTGSLTKAKQVLKTQALVNARKLFGSVGEQM
jgi:hypothetical protein